MPHTPRVLQQCVCGTKEGQGLEAHNQFEGAEQVCHLSPLHDGEYLQLERCHLARVLDVQNRFKRCLPVCPNAQIRLEISSGGVLPVQNPPFQPYISPVCVYQTPPSSCCTVQTEGSEIPVYLDDWLLIASDPHLLKDQSEYISSTLQSLGFLLNAKKCIMEPSQSIEFLGFIIDSRKIALSLPSVKVNKIHKECRHILNLFGGSGLPIIPHNWSHDISPTCHPPSPVTLQSPSASKARSSGTEGVPRLRHLCEAFIRGSRRSTVVDPLAWSSQRMAYLLQRERHLDRGTFDSRRVTSTHQLAGTKSGLPCHSDICETSMPCSNFSRQPGGSCVH